MSVEMHAIDLTGVAGRRLFASLGTAGAGALIPLSERLSRLFAITSPWAPGLHFLGAQSPHPGWPDGPPDPGALSLAGSGSGPAEALASCLGECAERLSVFERAGDVGTRAALRDVRPRLPLTVASIIEQRLGTDGGGALLDWCTARDPVAGCDVLLPAGWTVRRRRPDPLMIPGAASSSGVAAGPTFAEAALRAQLELVERDAAALWWIGGRRGRSIPPDQPAGRQAAALIARLRDGATHRNTWLLDITTDLAMPVVAAVSAAPDGTGVAIGLGARLSLGGAAAAALHELCQMEIGMQIALLKLRQAGPASLTPTDRLHAARAGMLDAGRCELLIASGPPDPVPAPAAPTDGPLIRSLAPAAGHLALVDLTRPDIGVPVVRAVAGHLQPMPGEVTTPRLAAALAAHGGGARWTRGLALM